MEQAATCGRVVQATHTAPTHDGRPSNIGQTTSQHGMVDPPAQDRPHDPPTPGYSPHLHYTMNDTLKYISLVFFFPD